MPSIAPWRPFNEAHSIQVCAVSVVFAEQVGDVVLRRSQRALEPIADTLGLSSRSPIGGVLPPPLAALGLQLPENQGVMFASADTTAGKAGDRFHLAKDKLRYEDFAYVRWAPFRERASALLSPALDVLSGVVAIDSVTSEYVDIFKCEAGVTPDLSKIINKGSPYLAKAAYSDNEQWHNHSGWFEAGSKHSRKLINLNIDVLDEIPSPTRFVRIQTVVINQYGRPGLEPLPDDANLAQLIDDHFVKSHQRLKDLLAGVLTENAKASIALKK